MTPSNRPAPASPDNIDEIRAGIVALRAAVKHFKGSPKTLARVRLALSSALGAERAEWGRVYRRRHAAEKVA